MRRRKRRSRIAIPLILIVAIIAIGAGWRLLQPDDVKSIAQADRPAGESQSGNVDEVQFSSPAIPEAVIVSHTAPKDPTDEVLKPVGSGGASEAAPDFAADARASTAGAADEPGLAQGPETENDEPTAGPKEPGSRLSANPRIDASLQRYRAGQVIAARQELNRMLVINRDPAEQAELRRHLEKIADATIFSRQGRTDDPLTTTYTIQPGDVLINVGKQFDVPHEVIMMINGIRDATRVRAGQKIKVPRGPFHAKIHKSKFRLDVYLQDLYLRSFPVGLGAEQETPRGVWKVKERLTNPTYYPPASASGKRIIAADDPKNPLGEFWIGLEGVEGDAVGRFGYGIHGTIAPESIGKAVSLGCVRMHNDDVEFLYHLMMRERSTVTILP